MKRVFTESPEEPRSLTLFGDDLELLDATSYHMHCRGKAVSCFFHAVCNGLHRQQLPEPSTRIFHVLRSWHLPTIPESSQQAIVENEARTCCKIGVCVCVRVYVLKAWH